MSESKIGKLILGILIVLIVIVASSQVFAEDTFQDLSQTLNNSTNNTTSGGSSLSEENNLIGNNTIPRNNTVLTTNNTVNNNTTNNSALPNTGIGDSMPIAILVVVLGISAVYAYKKIQDYKHL